jgi:zinc transport system substrate-binding protein
MNNQCNTGFRREWRNNGTTKELRTRRNKSLREFVCKEYNNKHENKQCKCLSCLTAGLLLSFIVGCSQSKPEQSSPTSTPTQESKKLKVVATFLPMYWFTKAVAGDVADVEILVPPGSEVHEYQAKPKNVQAIASASILVKNGLGLEEFLQDTIKNARNSKLVEIDASKGIDVLKEISPVEKASKKDKDHDHDHVEGNPHVWLDPVLVKQQVKNIKDGLIAKDPGNKVTYEANAAAYIKELDNLNNEFQDTLQKMPNCTFITFHDAFPYLAKRYNLKQIAVVEIPEDQLAPIDVKNAVDAVKKYQVKALFSEPGVDNKLLTVLAKDLNLTLRELDSLENGDTNPQHYFQAMKTNLQTLEAGCR